MIDLLKKYSILLIIGIVLSRILAGLILIIFPNILASEFADGGTSTLSAGYLSDGLEHLFNILVIIILAKDMKKEKINSPLILIMTFFFAFIGVIFFLLTVASNKVIKPQIELNE
ncbi:hypothetical protein F0365_13980 [Nonlabens sp. Ci31]|jgi:hypothetical protein|uniref:hypothetical protein n=1 Tax=Nonlabens sp. Ci31 TaxID=2608253 RepID=UPI0014632F69|nr:hypothetical protein [Nonlabens sp. Ci31]QJP35429.1 hypothetical protein F0365_13980 [Nonlabens sp. Ci31]